MIGRCIGETSLIEVSFISKEMPQVGEYVTLEYDGKIVSSGFVCMDEDCYLENVLQGTEDQAVSFGGM